ncbi:uncharacterized protein B0J16DRAFT_349312 [Fusarium flagelliforme]|uniref:Uncharacterized protein n=1 Tax=Fusarium flagelliforme TaxID=2675880 RepID=A0A395N2W0_9HYPO|nr:uncharacterized protein B0J16DRAFT_349312 [Fusarium flagelliforme]KAH7174885.1 hypothetical protein B0J16DRAFT_349312 [Fusarium flagelliforme]RFN54325.1 hypothetical protein FIE12Z_1451 [Fusarium flagelliforme]
MAPPAWLEKFIVRVDATPEDSPEPVLSLQYSTEADHERTVSVAGAPAPAYVIKRKTKLGGVYGDECEVFTTADGGRQVASIDFHTFPPRIEIDLIQDARKIKIKTYKSKREYEASSGLGLLYWKGTGMVAYGKASWELRSDSDLVLQVSVDDTQNNGIINLFKDKLNDGVIEELLVVGMSQIEEYKRMIRLGKRSAAMVVLS